MGLEDIGDPCPRCECALPFRGKCCCREFTPARIARRCRKIRKARGNLTPRIVDLRDRGLSWDKIGAIVGLSGTACKSRGLGAEGRRYTIPQVRVARGRR